MNVQLDSRVQYVKGVGPRKAEALAAAGIHTVSDLLLYLPFRYEDRSHRKLIKDLVPGEEVTIEVEVLSTHLRRSHRRRNFTILEVVVGDGSGRLRAVWFNQAFLEESFPRGTRLLLYGRVETAGLTGLQLKSPQYEKIEPGEKDATHAGRIAPIYERIGPISPRMFRSIFHGLIETLPAEIPGLLPASVERKHELPSRPAAIARAHFPDEGANLSEYQSFRSKAQKRLIFEELFLFALGIELRREAARGLSKKRPFPVTDRTRERVRKALPFALTGAQKRVLKTIADELSSMRPMRRLLQGDVGSGKTMVAMIAALIVVEHGAQVALMVPTELLAEQHFGNVKRVLGKVGLRVELLTSAAKRGERDALLEAIACGEVDVVVGTHALIQEQVRFKELGLAVIDEQHRFGVMQRAVLLEKAEGGPDLLVMTATPIPRSLAMALYGDLDSSELDELPPGRKPVETVLMDLSRREELYRRMDAELACGHQIYFVCPLIEESEKMDLRAAAETFRTLSEGPFAKKRLALVHGRLPAPEREAVMSEFAAGKIDVLVATTVIEVGVDVPNATLIVIDHAERFGLAQLHQLRGRVGRGEAKSTAILLHPRKLTPEAEARLSALASSTDGSYIAERDLEIRGPGDVFGTRQSGEPLFRVANVVRDRKLLEEAREDAREFLHSGEADGPEGRRILREVEGQWRRHFGLATVG